MEIDPTFQVRDYLQTDRDSVEEWHSGHGTFPPIEQILPRLGIVIERAGQAFAAMWLYMDNSVGVCFPEHVVTKPGISLRDAREALLVGLGFLRETSRAMGYGVMMVNTLPGIARVLRSEGFVVAAPRTKVTMLGLTEGRFA